MWDREIKEKSLVRTFTSFLNWCRIQAEKSMFDFQAFPQHNGLSKKMAPVDGSRLKPE